eukprot:scaffold5372_cov114-Isochrysis_galbana.AAC.12
MPPSMQLRWPGSSLNMAHLERALFGEQLRRQEGVESGLAPTVDRREPNAHHLLVESLRRHVAGLVGGGEEDAEHRRGQAREGGEVRVEATQGIGRLGRHGTRWCAWLVRWREPAQPAAGGAIGGILLRGAARGVTRLRGIRDGAFGQVEPEQLLGQELRPDGGQDDGDSPREGPWQRGGLGGRQRVDAPVGPADGQQRAADHPVRVPVDEVVVRVSRVDGESGHRVGEREELGQVGFGALADPWYVGNQDRPAAHAVQPRPALGQPEEHGGPPRKECVDGGVEHADHVPEGDEGGWLGGACRASRRGEERARGGKRRREGRESDEDGDEDVDGREDPRQRALQHVISPPPAFAAEPGASGRVSLLAIPHDLPQRLQVARPAQRGQLRRNRARAREKVWPGAAQRAHEREQHVRQQLVRRRDGDGARLGHPESSQSREAARHGRGAGPRAARTRVVGRARISHARGGAPRRSGAIRLAGVRCLVWPQARCRRRRDHGCRHHGRWLRRRRRPHCGLCRGRVVDDAAQVGVDFRRNGEDVLGVRP